MNVCVRLSTHSGGLVARLRSLSLGTRDARPLLSRLRLSGPAVGTALACTVAVATAGSLVGSAFAQDGAKPTPQPRESKTRIAVPLEKVRVDDGDTVVIVWGEGDEEIIRVLGIDTPETQHVEHRIPYDQPFGREAAGFAKGAFALATSCEILRADMMDPYGRTLGYLYLNGKNYSAAIVAARLAVESVSFYGDNGLPEPAAEVMAAAKTAGPVPFEPPHQYRRRMRDVSDYETAKH
ncbi:MAG: thermonuclease family protein [Candidatus Eisenbacteria bacterium]|uniref:Thermonuclease family protein n=1 Tax=Eiseniibacteriota bacterium TaxID=2212470 RepID=A0A956SEN1_UNCEI|nr:thermonuclease family protein [Candidatus Eisenbacteria bacterium]